MWQILSHYLRETDVQKQPPRGVLRTRCTESMQQIYRRTPMPKFDYWNHTSAWVFSCKFAAYFQNTFFLEHLWTAASGYINCNNTWEYLGETKLICWSTGLTYPILSKNKKIILQNFGQLTFFLKKKKQNLT